MTRTTIAGTAAALTAALIAAGAVSAASTGNGESGPKLAGAWKGTVMQPAPLPTLQSFQVYTATGGMIEASNQAPTGRSPMFGNWVRIAGRRYAATGVHFLFDPQTGAFAGTRRIDRTFELAQDGQSFTGIAKVTTFDPNGNVVGTGTATATAERMQVEPIQGQP